MFLKKDFFLTCQLNSLPDQGQKIPYVKNETTLVTISLIPKSLYRWLSVKESFIVSLR